jgi:hypothetical protein
MDLVGILTQGVAPPPLRIQMGLVTAVAATTCTVTIAGTSIPGIRRTTSFTPIVNDIVIILFNGPDLILLGSLQT